MATNYRTPGVYIEEISKFPPSVAQVETAIPAFIGYTEKAKAQEEDSSHTLINIPTRIVSMLEYEGYFGGPEAEIGIQVTVREQSGDRSILVEAPDSDDKSPFLMYYSMQAYFANGGGPCYIVSVGVYEDAPDVDPVTRAALVTGLEALEKEDEPTLILFPDATSLPDSADFYAVYNSALTQCRKLGDRFAIIDTYTDHLATEIGAPEGVRDMITSEIEYRKYGAVYYPYLETILNYAYDPEEITISHTVVDSTPVTDILDEVDDIMSEGDGIIAGIPAQVAAITDANTALQALDDADAFTNRNSVVDSLGELATMLSEYSDLMQEIVDNANNVAAMAVSDADLADAAADAASAVAAELESDADLGTLIQTLTDQQASITGAADGAEVKTASADALAAINAANVATLLQGIMDLVDPALVDALLDIEDMDMESDGVLDGMSMSEIEEVDSATYNKIKSGINKLKVVLPPSAIVAGVYARVDGTRGVWQAPANVSLNYVVKPTVKVTNEMQDRLNVDTTSGKSINAIRSFTGKGTLIWGARTLAGNDNEWRYVPVRRFFNMVEESVKKATEQFVFEPNDANTWVKVRAMIENFLVLQWRAGALAGAKPEHAFYVRVGLGQTMTALDILEGRMNVEIGMAAVRPAEFIILKFSHKMQES
ncbi:MAG: phage tail protein [Lunatimonas sp.]|uniref:phage tail sheath family protein n=1 Tax=Lunatimonas sp. TaxID=2060141 RepID=UPI00263BB9EB|nr:phage tail sheath C-terminal domain-containing protein [Lunatimonas sp.]MCC5938895.1 phage tail protein [Lunatimonas sp.]